MSVAHAAPALGAAAEYYARQFHFAVFPLHSARAGRCSCGRPDCGNPGKHPRTQSGFLDATTDDAQIRAWWDRWSDANIGIRTGRASGIVVVDVDPRNGGDDGLEQIIDQVGQLPHTVEALTGGGGRHILFAYPSAPRWGEEQRLPCGKLGMGVDFKADGGYIVAAPSVHASGRAYAWEGSSRPGEVTLAELPEKLLALATGKRRPAKPKGTVLPLPTPGRPRAAPISVALESSFIFLAFDAAGLLRDRIDVSRHAVMCPWEHEHSNRSARGDTSTIIFAPSEGRSLGWFHCSHSHCGGRTVEDALAALPPEAIATAKRREGRSVELTASEEEPTAEGDEAPPTEALEDDELEPKEARPRAIPVSDWKDDLTRARDGAIRPTYGNLCIIIRAVYGARLAYDEMRGSASLDGRPLADADVGRVREDLERTLGPSFSDQNTQLALRQIAEDRSFHPVREYLRGLKWDGELRLARVAPEVLGDADPLSVRLVHAWFASAVRRPLEPGCKVDTALVLVGAQGIRKSTFFNVLGGQWFSDSAMDISSRDGLMQLASAWIYEWGELESVTSKKQAAEVKSFITSPNDTIRMPYAKATTRHPRSSVIVGTTNEPEFLTDPTGSRRFWIINVSRKIDIEKLQSWRDQLWAEAVVTLESGYQTWLNDEEEAQREQRAQQHHQVDPLQDAIAEWLDGREARAIEVTYGWVTMADVLELALKLEPGRWDRRVTTRVGGAMRRLGWAHTRRRVQGGRLGWVYIRPGRNLDLSTSPEGQNHESDPDFTK